MDSVWEWLFWLNDYLGPVATFLQIATVLVAAYGLLDLWKKRRRLRRLLRDKDAKVRPGTMALSIGIRIDIKGNVESYLKENKLDWIHHESLFEEGTLPASRYVDLLVEVYRRRQRLASLGCKEVLLFFAGPIPLSMGIGSMLDNWVPIKVYEWDKTTATYVYVYTLEKGIVLDLLRR